jgi:ABC-type sugar transport system ATPase subunit
MLATRPAPAPQATAAVPLLALEGVSKSFPGVKALDGVALRLYPGEVTALVGENGAGKSTVVKILTGIYQPDAGQIVLDGAPAHFPTAHAAAAAGVTAIHQETVLFDELSVAENIFLGHAPRTRLGLIDWDRMHADARAMLARVGAPGIDARTRLRDLGIANKHLVAVARALSIDARVVIMDEPTAALSHKEIAELFALVEMLKAQGKAILFISHKFDEIFRIADRYTVFRDGKFVGEGRITDVTEDRLVTMMVGRSIDAIFPARRCSRSPATATRPSSRTFPSPSAAARSSASTAWSAPAAASSCRRSSASQSPRRARPGSTAAPPRSRAPPTRSRKASSTSPRTAAAKARSAACRSSRTSPCPRSTASRGAASSASPRSSG